ncbi:PLP-dependent transferase [Multifurca ochricompacta]|uniref:PLP-dependent transferase n=1 Tax=Multifurca ochricompacta TaxID=376703 RepID=A0AAD4MEI8_9AGAM|nr:PLP-dependent transferase [Multifurca ochricompacta]
MQPSTPLASALQNAHALRAKKGMPFTDLSTPIPSSAPDLFSNDYLSITTNSQLRHNFLEQVNGTRNLFGSRGSRLVAGNTPEHINLENYLQHFFNAPAALLFNSGYDANVAFFASVPQEGDAILCDELIHASCRDGMATSRARRAIYPFSHNSVAAFEATLEQVISKHQQISAGKATLFVAVESLYSMDGDFCPLKEFLSVLEQRVPPGCAHLVVDEAHSTGIYGSNGRGLVAELGLEDRVQTVLHTFGKARGITGAVLLTSPTVRSYLINYSRPFIFSTSLPYINLIAIDCSFSAIGSPVGDQLRERLHKLSTQFSDLLLSALEPVPKSILRLPESHLNFGALPVPTPIFPILTSRPLQLATFLQAKGYAAQPIPYPAVPRGQERIRVVVHAENTEDELREFIEVLLQWAGEQPPPKREEDEYARRTAKEAHSAHVHEMLIARYGAQAYYTNFLDPRFIIKIIRRTLLGLFRR